MRSLKTKFVAVALVAAVTFTGCCNATVDSKIEKDGSAEIVEIFDYNKAAMDNVLKSMGMTDPSTAIGKETKIVTKDGVEYYEASEKVTATSQDASKKFTDTMGSDTYVTGTTIYAAIVGEDAMSKDEQSTLSSMGYDFSSIKVTINVEFTSPIVSTTGKVDSTNPNKVTFSMDMSTNSTVIFATTDANVTQDSVKAEVAKLNTVKKTAIKKLKADKLKKKAKKATATLKYGKVKDAKSYEIEYSISKKFAKKKTKNVYTNGTTIRLKNLKKGKKYYVRVRTVKTNYAGTQVYSAWTTKSFKTKKK